MGIGMRLRADPSAPAPGATSVAARGRDRFRLLELEVLDGLSRSQRKADNGNVDSELRSREQAIIDQLRHELAEIEQESYMHKREMIDARQRVAEIFEHHRRPLRMEMAGADEQTKKIVEEAVSDEILSVNKAMKNGHNLISGIHKMLNRFSGSIKQLADESDPNVRQADAALLEKADSLAFRETLINFGSYGGKMSKIGKRISKLALASKDAEAERDKIIADFDASKEEIRRLRDEVQGVASRYAQKLDHARHKQQEWEKKLNDAKAEFQREAELLQMSGGSLAENAKVMEERAIAAEGKLRQTEEQLEIQESVEKELRENMKTLEGNIVESEAALASLQKSLANAESRVKEQNDELQQARAHAEKLADDAEAHAMTTSTEEKRQQQMDGLNQSLRNEIETIRKDKLSLENKLEEAKRQVSALENMARNNNNAGMEQAIAESRQEIETVKLKLSSVESELHQALENLARLRQELADAQAELDAARVKESAHMEKIKDLQLQAERFGEKVAADAGEDGQRKMLDVELAKANEAMAGLQGQVDGLQDKVADLQEKLQLAEEEVNRLLQLLSTKKSPESIATKAAVIESNTKDEEQL
eukprot:g3847.t1